MTTHKMGRHVFGTVYAPQLPAKTLMEYMGITKFTVVQRYINFSKAEKVSQFEQATRNIEAKAEPEGRTRASGETAQLVEALRRLAPRGKERAWAAFLDGLSGLFGQADEMDPETEAVEL